MTKEEREEKKRREIIMKMALILKIRTIYSKII